MGASLGRRHGSDGMGNTCRYVRGLDRSVATIRVWYARDIRL